MTDFLAMGGYAAYVWPAYGTAALLLGGLLWASLRRLRRNEKLLRELDERGPRRTHGRGAEIDLAAAEAAK